MKTRTSRTGWRADRAGECGTTLIEMLLVVAIMAVAIGGILLPSLPARNGASLKASAHDIANSFREARMAAVGRRRQQLVLIDTAQRTVSLTGNSYRRIAEGIEVRITSAQSEKRSATIAGVRFFENGSSTGGTVVLYQGGVGYEVRIDWLTGRVDVARRS